jgi:Glycosyltransferases, probably involved in cell wall biogenesis
VTIVVPAHNEEHRIGDCLKSLLNINYPEFEVIVVNDDSTDRTMEILDEILKLQPFNKIYLERFQTGKINRVYKSETHPNVTVISKAGGLGKAGAVNAGLTFARYKYVSLLDADTILEPDCLLNLMAHVQRNPEQIVGIGSYFGLLNGFKIKDGKILSRSFFL